MQIQDWKLLMTRSITRIPDANLFDDAPRLFPTIETVCEYNLMKLKNNNNPIATIKAIHTGPNASKATSDEAG